MVRPDRIPGERSANFWPGEAVRLGQVRRPRLRKLFQCLHTGSARGPPGQPGLIFGLGWPLRGSVWSWSGGWTWPGQSSGTGLAKMCLRVWGTLAWSTLNFKFRENEPWLGSVPDPSQGSFSRARFASALLSPCGMRFEAQGDPGKGS